MMLVRELRDRREIRLLNVLIARVHKQGNRPELGRTRYFVGYVEEMGSEYWVAGALLQDPMVFATGLKKFNIDMTNSYFIRRVARLVPRSMCGDVLVEFIHALASRIAGEGRELLITMGIDDHTNALYERAGFRRIGLTGSGKPVYVLDLSMYRGGGSG